MSEETNSEVLEERTGIQSITIIKKFEKDYTWEIKEFASYIDIFESTLLETERFSSNYNYDTKFQLKITFLKTLDSYSRLSISCFYIKIIIEPSHDLRKCIIKISVQSGNEDSMQSTMSWTLTPVIADFVLLKIASARYKEWDLTKSLLIKCNICEFYILNTETPVFHRCLLTTDFHKLHEDNILTDFTINVGNASFKVHKAILAARSPVFYAMFHHNLSEKNKNVMDITDIDPLAIKEMLRYIYTGIVDTKSFAFELFKAADKYQLEELQAFNIRLKEVPSVLLFANKHSLQGLKEKTLNLIRQHIQKIISTEEFAQLYPHEDLIKEVLENVVNK